MVRCPKCDLMSTGEFKFCPHCGTQLVNDSVIDQAISLVKAERKRQDEMWGADRSLSATYWLAVLTEEVGEVAKEVQGIVDYTFTPGCEYNDVVSRYITELIHVAAVAVAAIEGALTDRGV